MSLTQGMLVRGMTPHPPPSCLEMQPHPLPLSGEKVRPLVVVVVVALECHRVSTSCQFGKEQTGLGTQQERTCCKRICNLC